MKPVAIAVSVNNTGFAEVLAQGLVRQGKHYVINVAEPSEPVNALLKYCEVLVTDSDEKMGLEGDFEPYRVIRIREDTCRISALLYAIGKASERYRQEQGAEDSQEIPKIHLQEAGCRVIVFRSLQGGSGTTSLAVTAGRMLAGAYGERVLYVPAGPEDGSLCYRNAADLPDAAEKHAGWAGDLYYHLKNGRPVQPEDYFTGDSYGLEYLHAGRIRNFMYTLRSEELQLFIMKLQELGIFHWIAVDAGCSNPKISRNLDVVTDNQQDCREIPDLFEGDSAGRNEEGDVPILVMRNHGLENRMISSREWELIHDGESFLPDENGRVEIIMTKSYGSGVKIFSDYLMETLVNSVELW